jgi:N-acetylmuramoyl-L-alanine amidase
MRYQIMRHLKYYSILILIIGLLGTSNSLNAQKQSNKFVVVLDAGHGGKDPGKLKNHLKEKTIALIITKLVGNKLKDDKNVEIIYTRESDKFVTLDGRAKIANSAKADLFVSIHCNAHNSQAYGTETYVLGLHRNDDNLAVAMAENSVIYLEEDYEVTYDGFDPKSPESYIGLTLMQEEYLDQSILLADNVESQFRDKLKRKSRGVKQAGFLVLRKTYMPSVLIETGFITNTEEGAFLNSAKGQEKVATAIANAINEYKRTLNLDVFGGVSDQINTPKTVSQTKEEVYGDIVFKVQIAASSKKLNPDKHDFKGLNQITRNQENGLYKYYFGKTSDYLKIQELVKQAKIVGYEQAYVVAFKGEKKST